MKEFASNEKNGQPESTLNCSLQKCLRKCLVFKALWKRIARCIKIIWSLHFFFFFAFYTQFFAKRKDIGQVLFHIFYVIFQEIYLLSNLFGSYFLISDRFYFFRYVQTFTASKLCLKFLVDLPPQQTWYFPVIFFEQENLQQGKKLILKNCILTSPFPISVFKIEDKAYCFWIWKLTSLEINF